MSIDIEDLKDDIKELQTIIDRFRILIYFQDSNIDLLEKIILKGLKKSMLPKEYLELYKDYVSQLEVSITTSFPEAHEFVCSNPESTRRVKRRSNIHVDILKNDLANLYVDFSLSDDQPL
jgi:hypothetical protein